MMRSDAGVETKRRSGRPRTGQRYSVGDPINAIYDSNTPLFTKDAIRNLVWRIEESGGGAASRLSCSRGLSIAGIDGRTVDISLQLCVKHPVPPHCLPEKTARC